MSVFVIKNNLLESHSLKVGKETPFVHAAAFGDFVDERTAPEDIFHA